MLSSRPAQYEVADRIRAIDTGGIGAIHTLVQRVGLVDAINRELSLLKFHVPYHESDHVLNIAYNAVCGGKSLDDIDKRRGDEGFMDALEAQRIPGSTTAADFCRRFCTSDVITLMNVINEARLPVWAEQPDPFLDEAIIEADGAIVPTSGQCKEGMDISHKGIWGYHPLLISLANTQEPLFVINRSGNRPSHEDAAEWLDAAVALCDKAGFRKITLRGDTDFSQTGFLDGWYEQGIKFVFGYDKCPNLVRIADDLPAGAWKPFEREPKWQVKTECRARPENVKERIVMEREFENIRLRSESVAEFDYRPSACKNSYRMVVLRKNVTVAKGEQALFDEIRYLFYITSDRKSAAASIVREANQRCNQENLIAQLKSTGVKALHAPVDNLISNWAYMVMTALAWSLKAWFALLLPEEGRWAEKHKTEKSIVLKMEFRRFLDSFVRIPAQVLKSGRQRVIRILGWNPMIHIFLRGVEVLEKPLRC